MNTPAPGQHRVWTEDEKSFSGLRISPIRHSFHEHPLMQLSRLATLAESLYLTKQCRFVQPGTKQDSKFRHASRPSDGRELGEVFARISEPGSWVALYNIETDPEYSRFLNDVVDSVRPLLEKEQSGIHNVQGFLFISAPPSFTPFHIDRENNLWLQVHGRKVISVWDNFDRESVEGTAVEEFIMHGGLEKVRLTPENRPRAHDFDVVAGKGVYFPTTSPHMTSTERLREDPHANVSISVGVVFYTDQTRRTANAHILNHFLRRLGIKPRHAGESPLLDRLKYPLARALVWAITRFRNFKPKPGIVPGG